MNVIKPKLKFKSPLTPLVISGLQYIVVHHIEKRTWNIEDIHACHINDKGFAGVGYNEYIKKDGTVYIGRGDNVGAHCLGFNSVSYGIALEGDCSYDLPDMAQYKALVERIKFHLARFPSTCKTVGHRELNSTSCPGNLFPLEMLKKDVLNKMTESESIINNLVKLGLTKSKDYWVNVLDGKTPVNLEYLKVLLGKVKS